MPRAVFIASRVLSGARRGNYHAADHGSCSSASKGLVLPRFLDLKLNARSTIPGPMGIVRPVQTLSSLVNLFASSGELTELGERQANTHGVGPVLWNSLSGLENVEKHRSSGNAPVGGNAGQTQASHLPSFSVALVETCSNGVFSLVQRASFNPTPFCDHKRVGSDCCFRQLLSIGLHWRLSK